VAGGKYTTYRHMSQQTVNVASKSLPQEISGQMKKAATAVPLNPLVSEENLWRARRYVSRWSSEWELSEYDVQKLVDRHGMETQNILELSETLLDPADRWALEALHAIRNTMCHGLVDFYLRRTPLMLSRRDHGLGIAAYLASVFQSELGWSEDECQSQIQGLKEFVKNEYRWMQELSH
jgi:glycerol-3-phosphate dehydrogenase